MHPPLDRPHPDCQEVINGLKECHLSWKKYTGACNSLKTALDQCLREEKNRIMIELNKDIVETKQKEQELIREAFGKKETFAEYLAKDRDYRKEMKNKQGRQASTSSA